MIAGIDYSTRFLDVVLLDDDTDRADWHRFPLGDGDWFQRALQVRAVLPGPSWWEDAGVWLVGIEDPYSRFPQEAKKLGVVAGGILASLPADLCVIPTAASEWKREFTGSPSSSKVDVALRANELGFLADPAVAAHTPSDAYDAYGIAQAVRALNNRAIQRGAAA